MTYGTTHYYTMTNDRIQQVAEIVQQAGYPLSIAGVADFCCGDWPEGQEHQDWLNVAPVAEIASWVLECRQE